jgi:hypothetical protein
LKSTSKAAKKLKDIYLSFQFEAGMFFSFFFFKEQVGLFYHTKQPNHALKYHSTSVESAIDI